MRCPFCGHEDTQVKDSRPSEDNSAIRRRRFCTACGSRFTTFERVQLRELTVIKKDGGKMPFDRDKLQRSISIAVRKRPISPEQVELIVNGIQRQLETSGENEIPSKQIGEMVMEALSGLDPVAYVRFASVYRDFREAKDFKAFISSLEAVSNLKDQEENKMSKVRTNRSTSRLSAIQALYSLAMGDKTIDQVVKDFMSGNVGGEVIEENEITGEETFVPVIAAEPALFSGIMSCYADNAERINDMVNASFTEDWPKERVEPTLKAILQAGVSELMAFPDTPSPIIISEYVDIARSFYDGPEARVVNGILDRLSKLLREG